MLNFTMDVRMESSLVALSLRAVSNPEESVGSNPWPQPTICTSYPAATTHTKGINLSARSLKSLIVERLQYGIMTDRLWCYRCVCKVLNCIIIPP